MQEESEYTPKVKLDASLHDLNLTYLLSKIVASLQLLPPIWLEIEDEDKGQPIKG